MIDRLAKVVLLPALLVYGAVALAGESGALLPVIPQAAKGESCVEPIDVIRREHMSFLMHQRDDTVHGGIRGAKHSLVGCIDCHAQTDSKGAAIPIDAEGQFCESCHRFAGVQMDCFECHATVPASAQARGGLPAWMASSADVVRVVRSREIDP